MSASYAATRQQAPSFTFELLKDMFRNTALGLVIAALRSAR